MHVVSLSLQRKRGFKFLNAALRWCVGGIMLPARASSGANGGSLKISGRRRDNSTPGRVPCDGLMRLRITVTEVEMSPCDSSFKWNAAA